MHVAGDGATVERLGALIPDVGHPVDAVGAMDYTIESRGREYTVTEHGDVLAVATDPAAAADAVYVRAYRRAFEFASLTGWVRLHAVTADIDGRRHLFVGPSGVGKTTLALALCAAGHDVQGDESVLVRAGQSLAAPRGFHVKRGAEDLAPRFAGPIRNALRIGDVSVVDPHAVQDDWQLRVAPVDDIVFLATGGGGENPTVFPTPRHETTEMLLRESFVVTESKSSLLTTLLSVSAKARCRTLTRGPLGDMLAALHGEPQ